MGDVTADGRVDLADAWLIAAWLNDPADPSLPAGIGEEAGPAASLSPDLSPGEGPLGRPALMLAGLQRDYRDAKVPVAGKELPPGTALSHWRDTVLGVNSWEGATHRTGQSR